MIVAIMQPYFFPYIGYFQLMRAVDTFVFYDDVQYMKGGWINRNRILMDQEAHWLTLPIQHASVTKSINERSYVLGKTIDPLMSKIYAAYAKAKGFRKTYNLIKDILHFKNRNVAKFNINLLIEIASILELDCNIVASSDIDKNKNSRGESRVLNICKTLGSSEYINAIGGIDLYNSNNFSQTGITLSFLQSTCARTPLRSGEAYLSIIDTMMRFGWDGARSQLDQYKIVRKK